MARGPLAVMGLLAAIALLVLPSAASPATIHVANNGLDSPTCGAAATPCRSISQALVVAGAEPAGRRVPRILVGPGRYGDLDGDGALTGPGEEFSGQGGDCGGCVIVVARPAEIESTHGAALTVLVGKNIGENVVHISSSHVHFGKEKKGFTVMRGAAGMIADGAFATSGPILTNVSMAGNLAVRNDTTGLWMRGIESGILQGNVSIGNFNGIVASEGTGLPLLRGNLVIANTRVGISQRTKATVTGNAAIAGGVGFHYEAGQPAPAALTSSNVSVGNAKEGFVVELGSPAYASAQTYMLNSAIGNVGRGFLVGIPTDIAHNNIYGNGVAQPEAPFESNCGVETRGVAGGSVYAARNFWGASTGPGGDPADQACEDDLLLLETDPVAQSSVSVTSWNPW